MSKTRTEQLPIYDEPFDMPTGQELAEFLEKGQSLPLKLWGGIVFVPCDQFFAGLGVVWGRWP